MTAFSVREYRPNVPEVNKVSAEGKIVSGSDFCLPGLFSGARVWTSFPAIKLKREISYPGTSRWISSSTAAGSKGLIFGSRLFARNHTA